MLGYARAAALVKEALATNRPVYEVARDSAHLSREEIDRLLNLRQMTEVPGDAAQA